MSSRLLLPLFTALALFATACGGSTETTTAADEPAAIESAEEAEAPEETEAPDTTAVPEDTEPEETESTEGGAAEMTGQEVYVATCATCHGDTGLGGRGPTLVGIADKRPDKAFSINLATNGGSNMPAFGEKHTEAEIAAVVDFVYAEWPAPAS